MFKYYIKYQDYFLGRNNLEHKLFKDKEKAIVFNSKKEASETGRIIEIGKYINTEEKRIFIDQRYEIVEI